jgi:hypothetical protein
MRAKRTSVIPAEWIERSIFLIRGQKVMLDKDLAAVYGVTTARLNEQVRRNLERFPEDFAFVLEDQEVRRLMSQTAISKPGRGGRRKPPRVFTEHGAVMAASVLNTPTAVAASLQVVRAFVRLRELLVNHAELARKLEDLERKYGEHDKKLVVVFEAIRQLMAPAPPVKKRRIGFVSTSSPKDRRG